ncbi:hypothetical protein [Deinococcus xinjiangensis]|uniref:hypothetical protein n=1 Tax=Deinococcus xinjiangensis TaxID=457454 RepID=UPI003365A4FB
MKENENPSLLGAIFCACCGGLIDDVYQPPMLDGLCMLCAVEAEFEIKADDRLEKLLQGLLATYDAEYPGRLREMGDHGAAIFRKMYGG